MGAGDHLSGGKRRRMASPIHRNVECGGSEGGFAYRPTACVWNHYYDIDPGVRLARFRVRDTQSDRIVFETTVNFDANLGVFVVNPTKAICLAGGALPEGMGHCRGGQSF